jgi:anti-sigma B factor antagonist
MEEVKIVGVIDGKMQIALSGDIDLGNAETFYEEVISAYEKEKCDIEFRCEDLNFIDSTTLGTFVKILKAMQANGHKMRLVDLQAKIKKLFLICSLNRIMEIA